MDNSENLYSGLEIIQGHGICKVLSASVDLELIMLHQATGQKQKIERVGNVTHFVVK